MAEFIGQEIKRIRELVGPDGQVLGAVSGGVDSTVAAKLMTEAIGDRFHGTFYLARDQEACSSYGAVSRDLVALGSKSCLRHQDQVEFHNNQA